MFINLPLLFIACVLINKSVEEEFNMNFQQHDYFLKYERLELIRYNKNIVQNASLVTFKYNRTMAVTNGTFTTKIDVEDNLVLIVQVYKFMSNEYRYFPIRFATNGCEALKADLIGITTAFMRCGNFGSCPIRKGKKYEFCNWYPDSSKFPPLIPNGQYKIDGQLMHGTDELGLVNVLVTITRPIV